MNDSRINEIAKELDEATPKAGAKVDWRRQELVTNKQGLLRLAVELLYAATAPLKEGREVTDRNWDYLWSSQDIDEYGDQYPIISRISRTDSVDLPAPLEPTGWEKTKDALATVFVLGIILLFVMSAAVGCYTILKSV